MATAREKLIDPAKRTVRFLTGVSILGIVLLYLLISSVDQQFVEVCKTIFKGIHEVSPLAAYLLTGLTPVVFFGAMYVLGGILKKRGISEEKVNCPRCGKSLEPNHILAGEQQWFYCPHCGLNLDERL